MFLNFEKKESQLSKLTSKFLAAKSQSSALESKFGANQTKLEEVTGAIENYKSKLKSVQSDFQVAKTMSDEYETYCLKSEAARIRKKSPQNRTE